MQWLAVHAPLPSHTTPPMSLQNAPTAALVVPQHPIVHVLMRQSVDCAGQVVAVWHVAPPPQGPPVSPPASADPGMQAPLAH
jgi:hypothetical protein